MVDLLNIALDGVAEWRVIHPRSSVRNPGAVRDVAQAARAARDMGASTMILGQAIAVGGELRLRAELYDAVRGVRLSSVVAQGRLSEPGPAVDSLALGLARQRLLVRPGAVRRSLEEYSTSSVPALQAYLAAERLARRGAWRAAADTLWRAVAYDSTFGLAYYALYRAAFYGDAPNAGDQVDLIRRGLQYVHRLPSRQRDLFLQMDAFHQGRRAEALRRSDELTQRYPDDAEAALQAAEVYFHNGLLVGEAPERALEAFQRALSLDPGLLGPHQHVIELAVMIGDTALAWETFRRTPPSTPRFDVYHGVEFALRAALRGEDPATLAAGIPAAELAGTLGWTFSEVLRMLDREPARAVTLADSFIALAAARVRTRAERLTPLLRRHALLLAQGRRRDAWIILGEAAAADPKAAGLLASRAMHALVTGTHAVDGRAAARQLLGSDTATFQAPALVGWGAAVDGDGALLDSALAEIRQREAWRPAFAAALGAGLRGLAALRAGDSLAARRHLTEAAEVRQASGAGALWFPDVEFQIALARLERSAGDLRAASRRLHDTFLLYGLPWRAQAEELRGQIAEQQGDPVAAIRAYRNFTDLWKDADPELQARVAAARAAIERLEGR
jgi:tetratricopeptide (TPR) repeat protein